jgi:hypothetical protein
MMDGTLRLCIVVVLVNYFAICLNGINVDNPVIVERKDESRDRGKDE